MSKLFRNWYDDCEANYDSLSAQEKEAFDSFLRDEETEIVYRPVHVKKCDNIGNKE